MIAISVTKRREPSRAEGSAAWLVTALLKSGLRLCRRRHCGADRAERANRSSPHGQVLAEADSTWRISTVAELTLTVRRRPSPA